MVQGKVNIVKQVRWGTFQPIRMCFICDPISYIISLCATDCCLFHCWLLTNAWSNSQGYESMYYKGYCIIELVDTDKCILFWSDSNRINIFEYSFQNSKILANSMLIIQATFQNWLIWREFPFVWPWYSPSRLNQALLPNFEVVFKYRPRTYIKYFSNSVLGKTISIWGFNRWPTRPITEASQQNTNKNANTLSKSR